MSLHMENCWPENGHHYVSWSADSRALIKLYKGRLQTQLSLSPRCGHLKGNGGVKAAVRFTKALANRYPFVARFDIRGYYESIDHRILLGQLHQAGVSPDVIALVQDYLCVPDKRCTGKGMVAGGAISPLLGGLYLSPLDREMEILCRKDCIRYQRFMDDYVIFAPTRNKLRAAIKRMYAVLDSLQLTVHPDKRYIGKTEKGFDFLGYRFRPGSLLTPAIQSLTRLLERARRLQEKGADQHRLRQYVQRWVSWLHGGVRGAVAEHRFTQIWLYVNQKLAP